MSSSIGNMLRSMGNMAQKARASISGKAPREYDRPPAGAPEAQVVNFVVDKCHTSRRRLYSWQGLWYLLTANYVGRQWAQWAGESGALIDPMVGQKEVLITHNYIKPMVKKEAASISMGRIPWTVVPTSDDEPSMSSARMDNKLLDFYWHARKMRRWELRSNTIRTIFGMSLNIPTWDPTLGKHTGSHPDGRPKFEGAAIMHLRSPFGWRVDPDATSPDTIRWQAYEEMVDTGWLRLRYKRGKNVMPEQPDETSYLEHRLQHLSSHNFANIARTDAADRWPHHARLTKFYWYPDDKHPLGWEAHVAGGILLYEGPWAFSYQGSRDTGEMYHPIDICYYGQVPDRIIGQGLVEDLLELQWEYNVKGSQILKMLNVMAKPKWIAAKGHQMMDAPDDEPGELIEYTHLPELPNSRPEPITPDVRVDQMIAAKMEIRTDMMNVASHHEVSRGTTPPGVTSGKAIEALVDQDELPKAEAMAHGISTLENIGQAVVGLTREFGEEQMVLAIAGKRMQHEFFTWKKKDSRPGNRVYILSDGSMPMSRDEKRVLLHELMGTGLLDPMTDRNNILKWMEFGQVEEAFSTADIDAQVAKRENEQILASDTIPMAQANDDHDVHLQEHDIPLKVYREMTPEKRAQFMMHVRMHLAYKGQEHMRNANLLATAKGGMGVEEFGGGIGAEPPKMRSDDPDGAFERRSDAADEFRGNYGKGTRGGAEPRGPKPMKKDGERRGT